jgi:hypothetical protein
MQIWMVRQRLQDGRKLIGFYYLKLALLDRWRLPDRSDVAGERTILDGALEAERQDAMRMSYSAKRQSTFDQLGVPVRQVLGPELLQRQGTEVRNDLVRGELAIPFERLRRLVERTTQPGRQIFADSLPRRIGQRAVIGSI